MTVEELIELRKKLSDPAESLPRCARIVDQSTQKEVLYDPFAITEQLQATMLNYVSDPPRDAYGQTKWLVVVKYRQAGASLTGELAFYPKAAYNPGWDHVCIADIRDRAEYLHQRVQFAHASWPEDLRAPSVPNRETRQLTFDNRFGGKMRTLTAGGANVGIGQSFDSFHGSEVPFWEDAGTVMTKVIPAMINRDNVYVIMESTPAPGAAGSADYFKDLFKDGKAHRGRWISVFFPYWDGKLNSRPWNPKDPLSNEEIELLNTYGVLGLKKDNLAFRRYMLETDPELRRYPELFQVWYPFDDINCWISHINAAIPYRVLAKHTNPSNLIDWDYELGYKEYEEPEQDAIYVMGADPAGYGARDHASFQIIKIWDNEWKQVAVFGRITDPLEFAKLAIKAAIRFNRCLVVPEANGVGAAFLALLEEAGYNNVYHREDGKPGAWASPQLNQRNIEYLIDALLGCLILKDKDTVEQLQSYKNDKSVERSQTAEILTGDPTGKGRRERHHWDKVSALIYAVLGAREMPQRRRRVVTIDSNVVHLKDFTYNQAEKYMELVARSSSKDEEPTRAVQRHKYRSRTKFFNK